MAAWLTAITDSVTTAPQGGDTLRIVDGEYGSVAGSTEQSPWAAQLRATGAADRTADSAARRGS